MTKLPPARNHAAGAVPARPRSPWRRRWAVLGAALALAVGAAACGSGGQPTARPTSGDTSADSMANMPGMHHMSDSDGLSDSADGYRLSSGMTTLPAGSPISYRFSVLGPDGHPVTAFQTEQTQQLHFYAIRSDLTGFQHVHPVMAADGTWTAGLAPLTPGSWRLFASFAPATGGGEGPDLVLSRTVNVPGATEPVPLPAAEASTVADGYTVHVSGELMAGMMHPLTLVISRDGRPVTDLEPYLGTFGHLTAFHEGDLAFAHLHPQTVGPTTGAAARGGPDLQFGAELSRSGSWRLFLQFQTGGVLHTAALTLDVA